MLKEIGICTSKNLLKSECANFSDYTFEKGYDIALNSNVARIASNCIILTTVGQLTVRATILEVYDLAGLTGVNQSTFEEKFLTDIIILHPVILTKRPYWKKTIINVNEMLLTPSSFIYFFNDGCGVDINEESNTTN